MILLPVVGSRIYPVFESLESEKLLPVTGSKYTLD